jgi:lipid II:glycine glycyltransferase (peptidoglycan interpeptide bridge formation enzyme)
MCFLRLEPEWEQTQIANRKSQIADPQLASPKGDISLISNLQSLTSNLQSAIQPTTTIHVDLRPSPDMILAQMKPKWRYNIRLAERKGLNVRVGAEADLAEFYRLSQITSQRDGFAIHSEAYYRTAWQLFNQTNSVALFVAEFEGRAIASIMVFACGRMALYLYGASSDEERNRMPNHLLQWRAMLWAKARGCEMYDLWGVPDMRDEGRGTRDREQGTRDGEQGTRNQEREAQNEERGTSGAERGSNSQLATRHSQLPEGLLRFKEGFGGHLVRYVGAYDLVYRPWLYRVTQWAEARRRGFG